ncbi:hypothetical protein R0G64_27770 [Pseudomonas otitidis]|uniref:Uncharacterized protein n=1 Tax=Metapseudomonas otitidis TaxID=319939 RepID=A0ABU3XZ84_9GAMM|nr:hypothetical protein [Pseudomonas otitidis]MDV3443216.1 hypothetical protein [Pseudomonas otitidis]
MTALKRFFSELLFLAGYACSLGLFFYGLFRFSFWIVDLANSYPEAFAVGAFVPAFLAMCFPGFRAFLMAPFKGEGGDAQH